MATEAKLREELASALALANAALHEEKSAHDHQDAEREKESEAALRLELQSVEEQAALLTTELELMTSENMELQSTVAALSATVAVESEASGTARTELESARKTIEKQRARISSLRKQLARATSAPDESASTPVTRRRRNSDSGIHVAQNATARAALLMLIPECVLAVLVRHVHKLTELPQGGFSWGHGPGATFGRASTGRSGTPDLRKGHRQPAAQRDDNSKNNTRQNHGGESTRGGIRKQHLVSSTEQAAGGGGRGRRGNRSRHSLSPEPAVTVCSSPASAIALSGLLEERDRLRNILALARDAHADETARLKSQLASARASAERWEQACAVARSQLATAEAELKQRRRKASRAAKLKRDTAEQFKAERFEANQELRNQLQASGQSWSNGAGANASSFM